MKRVMLAIEKNGTRVFDVSTPELREKAYLFLFKERLGDGYWYLKESIENHTKKDLAAAKKGDAKAAIRFLIARRYAEYERVEETDVEDCE